MGMWAVIIPIIAFGVIFVIIQYHKAVYRAKKNSLLDAQIKEMHNKQSGNVAQNGAGFCSYCGAPMLDKAAFCQKCGKQRAT